MWWDGDAPRTIGNVHGASSDIVQRSIKRMCSITRLAVLVMEVEFPDFDIMAAFMIFNLFGDSNDSVAAAAAVKETAFERLAKVFKVEQVPFRAQVDLLKPIASKIFLTETQDNREAWRRAVQKTSRPSVRANYPISDLLPVLEAYMAWSFSSSGVEQNFSVMDSACPSRASQASDRTILDHLTILTHSDPQEEHAIFEESCAIWRQLYGDVRGSGPGPRLRGYKRKAAEGLQIGVARSLEAWKRQRRAEVAHAVKEESTTLDREGIKERAKAIAGDLWSESHQREEDRQKVLRSARLVEAASRHQTVAREETATMQATVAAMKQHEEKLRRERDRADARAATIAATLTPRPQSTYGHTVHVDARALPSSTVDQAPIAYAMSCAAIYCNLYCDIMFGQQAKRG